MREPKDIFNTAGLDADKLELLEYLLEEEGIDAALQPDSILHVERTEALPLSTQSNNCRSRLPSSVSGSYINSSLPAALTTWPEPCAWWANSMSMPSAVAWTRSCADTNLCTPPSSLSAASPCRSSPLPRIWRWRSRT